MPQGAILTNVGLSKIASATPIDQLNVVQLAVGDGAGGYHALTPDMTGLVNEVWRGTASNPIRDPNNENVLIFEAAIPASAGPFTIREQAIFDDAGDMIAIGQTSVVEKPDPTQAVGVVATMRLHVALSNAEQVSLFYTDTPATHHNSLTNRDDPDSHPMSAITGLDDSIARTLEKSLGSNARIWPKQGNLQVGDVIPAQEDTADELPITHVIVDGNVYAMSPLASGVVTVVTNNAVTVGGNIANLTTPQPHVIHDVSEFGESLLGDKIKLISYHRPTTNAEAPYLLSGGDFIYCDLPRSLHNGGTIISPTVPCVTPFTNESLIDFLEGVGEVQPSARGVWLRVDFQVNLSNFGADPRGGLYSDKVFQHAVNSMYTTSDGITGTGVAINLTQGIYKIEYPLVFDKDYIKLIASGENETVLWKPGNAIRTDLGTNIAPLRDDVGGVVDSYDVDAMIIYTHPDNGFRFGSEVRGVRMSGKSEDPAQSLTSYRPYGIYAPRAAQCTHSGISATRIARLYYTFDTFKHTAEDLVSNFGGGIFYYVKDSSGKAASGTSLTANNCWASRPLTEAGLFLGAYEIEGLEYSTLTACSADNMFEPWRLKNSRLDISSGSTEIARSASAFVIDGGNVTFTNLRTVAPAHVGATRAQMVCKGGAKVRLIGGKMSNRSNPDNNDIGVLVTDGASLISEYFEFPTTGTPYKIDMQSESPARSAVITDENGISRIFDTQNPDGYFNAPKVAVSENTLLNKDSLINNRHKYRGREVISQQTNKTLTATGINNTDPWVDSNGVIVITPI